jgi:hypothetical protein
MYVSVKLIENFNPLKSFPDQSIVPKIGFERQKYLFEKIRDYCKEDSKDSLCPDPTKNMFAPTSQASLNTTTRQTERVRKIAECSICHKPGHKKTKCPQNQAK